MVQNRHPVDSLFICPVHYIISTVNSEIHTVISDGIEPPPCRQPIICPVHYIISTVNSEIHTVISDGIEPPPCRQPIYLSCPLYHQYGKFRNTVISDGIEPPPCRQPIICPVHYIISTVNSEIHTVISDGIEPPPCRQPVYLSCQLYHQYGKFRNTYSNQ